MATAGALHSAARDVKLAEMDGRIRGGADKVWRDNLRRTALHLAARDGRASEVERLLRAGAAVNDKDNEGWTPLHYAAESGSSGDSDSYKVVARLLAACAAVDERERSDGRTPLHVAALRGDDDVVAYLLAAGAAVDATTQNGWTPLQIAAKNGQQNVAGRLLAAGAAVNERLNGTGKSPLALAVKDNHRHVAQLLVAWGAKLQHVPAFPRYLRQLSEKLSFRAAAKMARAILNGLDGATAACTIDMSVCFAAVLADAPAKAPIEQIIQGIAQPLSDWQRTVAALRSRLLPPVALTRDEFDVLAKAVRDSRNAARDALVALAPAMGAYWLPRVAKAEWDARLKACKAAIWMRQERSAALAASFRESFKDYVLTDDDDDDDSSDFDDEDDYDEEGDFDGDPTYQAPQRRGYSRRFHHLYDWI